MPLNSNPHNDDKLTIDCLSHVWDSEYRKGRYRTDPPLKFTIDIIRELKNNPSLMNGQGLYVGCGNGRNYMPLAESGLKMIGLDVSSVALEMLSKRLPQCKDNLVCSDFLNYKPDIRFQYLIAIQVFQHGTISRVERYFEKASSLLESVGMMFLRINASNTILYRKHEVIEKSNTGGFTVRYTEGPKNGLDVHFISKEDLLGLVEKNGMYVLHGIKNVTMRRSVLDPGTWSQWELIVKKD